MYDTSSTSVLSTVQHTTPVLDTAYSGDGSVLAGATLGGEVSIADVGSVVAQPSVVLGSPSSGEALSSIEYVGSANAFVAGGWDASVSLWDPRAVSRVGSTSGPGKVYALAVSGHRVVVGCAGRHVYVYDVRNMAEPEQRRESSLKHQTRSVATSPDGASFAVSSIEGRVSIEYFDMDPAVQKQKFAFKCHRTKADPVAGTSAVAYPVNALAFHPKLATLATGGADGAVNVWDPKYKRKLAVFGPFQTSIAALAFSPDGASLALASSYTFELGERDSPQDAIFIRSVIDAEFKSKGPKKRR